MYKKRYPPARYLFYPLYRRFRMRWRMPIPLAYFTVYLVSGVLHGLMLSVTGNAVAAVGFALLFVILGIVGAIITAKKLRDRRILAE